MALTSTEKKEIEIMIRKEIKSFMENNTIKQFEDKLMDKISKEIKRGKLEGDVKNGKLILHKCDTRNMRQAMECSCRDKLKCNDRHQLALSPNLFI